MDAIEFKVRSTTADNLETEWCSGCLADFIYDKPSLIINSYKGKSYHVNCLPEESNE